MEADDFWHLMETARSYVVQAGTFDQALVELLVPRWTWAPRGTPAPRSTWASTSTSTTPIDFHDAEQMHLRLPRLAALHLTAG